MRALVSWPWPGNVRELEEFIERSVIRSPARELFAPVAELHAGANEMIAGTTLGLHRTTLNGLMQKLRISLKDL